MVRCLTPTTAEKGRKFKNKLFQNHLLNPRYAFITYGEKSEAEAAKEALNGQTVCGQEIKVDVAKPRGSARPRGPGRGGGEGRGRGGPCFRLAS